MRKITLALFLLVAGIDLAAAQSVVRPCYEVPGQPCQTVSTSTPLPVAVESGGSTPGAGSQPYNYTAVAGGQYNLGVVTSTALTVPATALQAQVCAAGNSVNYTFDGTTVTASVGMPLTTGQCIQFSGATLLAALRFIQTAATATLNVSYTK